MRRLGWLALGALVPLLLAGVTSLSGAALELVEVQGRGGGPILTEGTSTVSGTVELGPSTRTSLLGGAYGTVSLPQVQTLTTTPVNVPATPLAGRCQWLGVNESPSRAIWCCIGSGCVPTATAHYPIGPNYGERSIPARDTEIIRCRAESNTANLVPLEATCATP